MPFMHMSVTYILRDKARQQYKTTLGRVEDAGVAQDVPVHQSRRDA